MDNQDATVVAVRYLDETPYIGDEHSLSDIEEIPSDTEENPSDTEPVVWENVCDAPRNCPFSTICTAACRNRYFGILYDLRNPRCHHIRRDRNNPCDNYYHPWGPICKIGVCKRFYDQGREEDLLLNYQRPANYKVHIISEENDF